MDTCAICLKPTEQLYETGKDGVYSCLECQPLTIVPEIKIEDTVQLEEVSANVEIVCTTESEHTESELADSEQAEYCCNLCGKSFHKNQQYQNHVRNHRAERRYVCTYCEKAFSQSNNLRAHLRIHTNERPYKCNDCGKAFTQVTNLNNHVRLHTGERPFVCPEPGCHKAFAQVTNLNQHQKRHMNGRPVDQTYDCNVCGAQFEQRNHMYVHRKQEHPEARADKRGGTPTSCAECGESFASERQMSRHYTTQHVRGKAHLSLEPAFKCMFENCGRGFALASQHAEHLLKTHQLKVSGNFAVRGVTVKPTSVRITAGDGKSGYVPARRGRPPKSQSAQPEPAITFQFVATEDVEVSATP